jgi:twinkle protein
MLTLSDCGIALLYGATGEARTVCPQCSPSRRKSRDACLAVNADAGTWYCHHCGWRGGLHGRLQAPALPLAPRPPAQPNERRRLRYGAYGPKRRPSL